MKNQVFLALSMGSCLLFSCSPKYYSPNTQNVPLITEKNETNLTFAGNANQVEFQGAFGITNNIAIKANGGFFIPVDTEQGDGGSGRFFEFGGGYFRPIGENFVFETYGIVGFGTMENHFPSSVQANPQTRGNISANILRYGIQPNFGYKSKYFSAAISSRIVNLNYNNISGDLIFAGEDQLGYLNNNSSNFLVEPALTIKGGLERIKLQLQLGRSFNLSNQDFKQDFGFLTFGLNFNFN